MATESGDTSDEPPSSVRHQGVNGIVEIMRFMELAGRLNCVIDEFERDEFLHGMFSSHVPLNLGGTIFNVTKQAVDIRHYSGFGHTQVPFSVLDDKELDELHERLMLLV